MKTGRKFHQHENELDGVVAKEPALVIEQGAEQEYGLGNGGIDREVGSRIEPVVYRLVVKRRQRGILGREFIGIVAMHQHDSVPHVPKAVIGKRWRHSQEREPEQSGKHEDIDKTQVVPLPEPRH